MDKLEQIFDQQRQLMDKFHAIEQINEPCVTYCNINTYSGQRNFRQLAWFAIEELGEVLHADQPMELNIELADVFHFLIELAIQAGITHNQIIAIPPASAGDQLDHMFAAVSNSRLCERTESTLEFVRSLTFAVHELKFKPWKQNPKPTNHNNFKVRIVQSIYVFIEMAIAYGLTSTTLHQFYMGKAIVNNERIDSSI